MKKYIYSITYLTLFALTVQSQTISNFNGANCKGQSVNLFAELDLGKTVVLLFENQSSACLNVCNNLEKLNISLDTNKVKCIYIDLMKGSKCADLEKWKTKNKLSIPVFIGSNDFMSIKSSATPHIIVAAGFDHKIYYSGAWNEANIKTAIETANANAKPINPPLVFENVNIVSSPNSVDRLLNFSINQPAKVLIELQDETGKSIKKFTEEQINEGTRTVIINTTGLAAGNYIISISSGSVSAKAPLSIQ